eukprot:gb/GEZN01008855.1/.p1 GENE.gb/GEZN01008855.1/~~gb/GEZN01008855.1/.p1  ORF type:complete len:399 (-),score=33.02 gb/GEZN01008855.1/:158-1354(-)
MTSVVVAALQLPHTNDSASAFRHATAGVEEAVGKGAKIILLPELYFTGYSFQCEELWPRGELLRNGPTVSWLQAQCVRHRVCIGTSCLEVEGLDFFNTFVLIGPSGSILGTSRKALPASMEAFTFKKDPKTSHLIRLGISETALLGLPARPLTIGVLICYENLVTSSVDYFTLPKVWPDAEVPQLFLMPFSGPSPPLSKYWSPEEAKLYDDMLRYNAKRHSVLWARPCVMANKVGAMDAVMPLKFHCLLGRNYFFHGFSTITDASGTVLASSPEDEAAVLTATVPLTFNPTTSPNLVMGEIRAQARAKAVWGRKFLVVGPTSFMASCGFWENLGACFYYLSLTRRQQAWRITHPKEKELPLVLTRVGVALQSSLSLAAAVGLGSLVFLLVRRKRSITI